MILYKIQNNLTREAHLHQKKYETKGALGKNAKRGQVRGLRRAEQQQNSPPRFPAKNHAKVTQGAERAKKSKICYPFESPRKSQ